MSWKSVSKAFLPGAKQHFAFLAEAGFAGPEEDTNIIQEIAFHRPDIVFRIYLDSADRTVITTGEIQSVDVRLVAELGKLVRAADIDPAERVRTSVPTVQALQQVLANQADYLRRWLSTEVDDMVDLFREAGAREWRSIK